MDLAQKASRVKKHLQAAVAKPESTSIRHAVESFDAFVDGVVEEIAALKKGMSTALTPSPTPAETFTPAEGSAEPASTAEEARAPA
ncbi:MAG TPA: hypothetical protein VHM00_02845 [Caldimonas sp.]|nr:hypothetical protein [Caldimonas sp.]HEX2540000.1 hypothetical protein [Caldimonas sp.]